MSCWVVPTLAAEYWGISVDDVMRKIDAGDVNTRDEHGFTLIDVAPNSPRQSPVKPMVYPSSPAKTYHESQIPTAIEDFSETVDRDSFGDFRLARIQTARLRKSPDARMLN